MLEPYMWYQKVKQFLEAVPLNCVLTNLALSPCFLGLDVSMKA